MPWLTPDSPPDEGGYCRTIKLPESPELLYALNGAFLELTRSWNWQQFGDMTPEQTAEIMQVAFLDYLDSTCGDSGKPFWDDPEGDDAGQPSDEELYPWYEQLADWVISGFLASTFTPAAAVVYETTIPRARLAFRKGDWAGMVQIFIDGIMMREIDLWGEIPSLLTVVLDIRRFNADHGLTGARRITVKHAGLSPQMPLPEEIDPENPPKARLDVIRKNLIWSLPAASNAGGSGRGITEDDLEYDPVNDRIIGTEDKGETWEPMPKARDYRNEDIADLEELIVGLQSCDAAARMTAFLREAIDGVADEFDAGRLSYDIGDWIRSRAAWWNPVDWLFWPLVILVTEVVETVGSSIYRTALGNADWDEIQCKIHCTLGSDAVFSERGWKEFTDWLLGRFSGIDWQIMRSWTRLLGRSGFNAAAATRTETGDCTECLECEWSYHITPADFDLWYFAQTRYYNCDNTAQWGANHTPGSVVPWAGGVGWRSESAKDPGYTGYVFLSIAGYFQVSDKSEVTGITAHYTRDGGASSNLDNMRKRVEANEFTLCTTLTGAAPLRLVLPIPHITDRGVSWKVQFASNNTNHDNVVVTSIEIRGTGVNPFWERL